MPISDRRWVLTLRTGTSRLKKPSWFTFRRFVLSKSHVSRSKTGSPSFRAQKVQIISSGAFEFCQQWNTRQAARVRLSCFYFKKAKQHSPMDTVLLVTMSPYFGPTTTYQSYFFVHYAHVSLFLRDFSRIVPISTPFRFITSDCAESELPVCPSTYKLVIRHLKGMVVHRTSRATLLYYVTRGVFHPRIYSFLSTLDLCFLSLCMYFLICPSWPRVRVET